MYCTLGTLDKINPDCLLLLYSCFNLFFFGHSRTDPRIVGIQISSSDPTFRRNSVGTFSRSVALLQYRVQSSIEIDLLHIGTKSLEFISTYYLSLRYFSSDVILFYFSLDINFSNFILFLSRLSRLVSLYDINYPPCEKWHKWIDPLYAWY